jgi:class 3 adenylate cyclase
MKLIFRILIGFFTPEKQIQDPIERLFFYFDISTTNISRLITFSYVLSIGLIGILIFDGIRFINNTLDSFAQELAITHIIFLFYSISLIFFSKFIVRRIQNPIWFRVYFFVVTVLLFGILIWTSLIDQMANGQITVMIMGYYGISALLFLFPIDSLLIYFISLIVFFILLPYYQENKQILTSHYINLPILALISYFISVIFFKTKVKDFLKSKKIESINSQLDDLVQKILPTQIAYKLREENRIEPRVNSNVTIAFVDFVSFSSIMEKTHVEIVFTTLDELFSEFDKIIKKHNLEKIKTIGDSYMFCGGLFTEASQAKECVDASLEIIEFLEKNQHELRNKTGHNWFARIGIDKGDVITGIIGNWRFVFDVWGNAVNIASRLESASLPQKINVSRKVYEEICIYDNYYFESRGILPIKNMEPVEMYFILKR